MRKVLALGVAIAALAVPAVSQAQGIHLVNHAGLSGSQISHFKAAGRDMINHRVNPYWHSPHLSWSGSAQTIEFVNSIGPVNRYCGGNAAGCHGLKNGRPYAIVDTNKFETGRIWSVTGTHELGEMWVDPRINHFTNAGTTTADFLVEVGDPVEDFSRSSHGVQVTDFALPNWYHNVGGRQDDFNRLPYESGSWFLSCPTGYASYVQDGRWFEMTPSGCAKRGGSLIGHTQLGFAQPHAQAETNLRGDRVSVFPIKR